MLLGMIIYNNNYKINIIIEKGEGKSNLTL